VECLGKIKDGIATSVYLPKEWPEYRKVCEKKLGISASARLSQLMLKDLAEMKGQSLPSQQNIQDLELEIARIIVKCKKIGKYLVKQGTYKQLENLVDIDLKLDDTFANLDDVISKMLEYEPKRSDDFGKDDLELMVQLLGLNRDKRQKKKTLDDMRLGRYVAPPQVSLSVEKIDLTQADKNVAPNTEALLIVSAEPAVSIDSDSFVAPTKVDKEAENEGKRKRDEEAVRKIATRPLPQPCYTFKKGVPQIRLLSNSELAELKELSTDSNEEEDEETQDSEADE
jgi:hypothetical protein